MPDIIDQIYPWRHFSIQEWKKGRVPWWNPNSFSGNPHLANFQSAAFSPINALFFILPFLDAWSLMVLLQPFIAGVGTYLLLRRYKVSEVGSLIGSIAWMFSGFIVVWMAYGTLSMAICILPLVMLCLENVFTSGKLRWGVAGSFLLAFSFFSGHFQTSLYILLVSIGYCIFYFFLRKDRRRVFFAILWIGVGLGISSMQLLPAVQLYNLSPRSDIFLYSGGIPIHYLVTLFAPDFYGNPVTRNDWFGYYAEWSSFIGIVPLFLAFFTLARKQEKEVRFFQLSVLISLLFTVESPLQKIVGSLQIPVLSTSAPSRLIVIASFSLCVLAGFGYDVFREKIQRSLKYTIPYIIFFLVFLASVWTVLLIGVAFSPEHLQIAKKNFLLPTGLLTCIVGLTFGSYLLRNKKKFVQYVLIIPLLLVSVDSLRFAIKWMPFDPRDLVFPSVPVISAMQREIGNGRVYGNIGAQVATYYNLPIIEGYDPLYIDRYGEFIRSSATGEFLPSERSVVKISNNGKYLKRVLNLLGVNLIYHPNADTNQSWAFAVWEDKDYKVIYTDDLFTLYNNPNSLFRPSLYYTYEVIPDGRKLLSRFYTESFDYRNTLLLEEDPGIKMERPEKNGHVTVVSETPTSLRYSVETSEKALLFLSDNYYPGWKAKVNGKEVKIFRADYTFRAVVVPKGESIVEFFYSPSLLNIVL
ncbi:MAG: YfhO family protein [Candidatus Levybacteria bacterium]|nr:YfhO family protein [Candidatus Levybacteria bacterium]